MDVCFASCEIAANGPGTHVEMPIVGLGVVAGRLRWLAEPAVGVRAGRG
jgi:hypothetical protein